jgi:hypothetical protein
VVGVVAARSGEGWRVDIGSAHFALLDGLAFEGATKRNKPNLKVLCILLQPVIPIDGNSCDRLDLYYSPEFHWHTKTWSQSWNALTRRHERQTDLENLRGDLWCAVA